MSRLISYRIYMRGRDAEPVSRDMSERELINFYSSADGILNELGIDPLTEDQKVHFQTSLNWSGDQIAYRGDSDLGYTIRHSEGEMHRFGPYNQSLATKRMLALMFHSSGDRESVNKLRKSMQPDIDAQESEGLTATRIITQAISALLRR